jgi:hypothetical protein
MSVNELVQSARFLVDANGNKTAIVIDLSAWQELLTLLEDLEEADEIRPLRNITEEPIPWEQARTELRVA